MKIKRLLIFLLGISFLTSCFDNHPKADMVLFNSNIYTVNSLEPKAEAIAIKEGKIVYVGNNVNANNWVTDSTQVLDLSGMTIVPGFIEGHGHIMGMGFKKLNLDLSNAKSFDQIIKMVEKKANSMENGEWIIGRGWHQEKWTTSGEPLIAGFPINKRLSEISPKNPVVLEHASGHAILVNQAAIQLSGIKHLKGVQENADIIKDSNGNLTGIFSEGSMGLIKSNIPERSDERRIEALNYAIEECLSNGVTSFQNAGTDQQTINLFHSFLKNDMLKIRMYAMIKGRDHQLVENWFVHGPSIGLGNNFLTIRSIKLVADGALGSRGALLMDDYTDAPDQRGSRIQSLDYIMRTSEKAFNKGFQINTHCIGDQANKDLLDIYEIVFQSDTTKKNSRFRIEHAQHLRNEDIPRFGQMGVIPSVQAIHHSSDRPWAIDRLGKERIENGSYPWRSLIDSGAKVMNGTDVPVEPISPIANFYASVSRKTLFGGPDGGYEPKEKMSRQEALESMTINAAFGAFEDVFKGSIEVGKVADFAVLSQDIMKVSEAEILNTEVLYTVVDGKVVFKK
ncbi:MAG: amidohydrolase [Reichenbachiella sp.]